MSACFYIYKSNTDKVSDYEDCYIDYDYEINLAKDIDKRVVKRIKRKLDDFPRQEFVDEYGKHNLISCEKIAYMQGWFLKPRFFHKKYTKNICISKKEITFFFNKYLDYHYNCLNIECINNFIDKFEDNEGMIFICSW